MPYDKTNCGAKEQNRIAHTTGQKKKENTHKYLITIGKICDN